MGGDAVTIASDALCHLKYRRSPALNGWDAAYRSAAIANSLLHIEELSRKPYICEGLVSHNCIPILVEVLKDLSDRPEQFDDVVNQVCMTFIS